MNNWWDDPVQGLIVCSRRTLAEVGALLPPAGRMMVARLQGARMPDADHAMYELSDALLFPGYFGWNWDALSDCLRDLNWLQADAVLLVVEDAPRLLSSNTSDRRTLFQILSGAVQFRSSALGTTPLAFRVLLLCDNDDHADLLRQEIAGWDRSVRIASNE